MDLYQKLTAQGDQVRGLKTAKAEKVSACKLAWDLTVCVIKELVNLNSPQKYFLPVISSPTDSFGINCPGFEISSATPIQCDAQ